VITPSVAKTLMKMAIERPKNNIFHLIFPKIIKEQVEIKQK
jgi:hypothetical protein